MRFFTAPFLTGGAASMVRVNTEVDAFLSDRSFLFCVEL